jgi:DNA-binding transcriptional MerR regulator
MPNVHDADLLDDPQAAAFLNITQRTLRLWRRTRGVPHLKITAKVIRYHRSDLATWVNRCRKVVML